jgi:cation/acetate symporter
MAVVLTYLVAQMVGAGYAHSSCCSAWTTSWALVIVGCVMMTYVLTFGGMIATTWVQIIKACLLLIGGTTVAVLGFSQFGFSFEELTNRAMEIHRLGVNLLAPAACWPTR